MGILFRLSTLLTFLVVTLLAFLVSYLLVMNLTGTMRMGLPFSFLRSSSAPMSAAQTQFSLLPFLADLLFYYLIAAFFVWAWGRFVAASPS